MKYITATLSENGPRADNEDTVGVAQIGDDLAVSVADGLGGLHGGKHASQLAVRIFENLLANGDYDPADFGDVGRKIHGEIREVQNTDPQYGDMSTTLTGGLFAGGRLHVVHCGDTRLAVLRRNRLWFVTEDHTRACQRYLRGRMSLKRYLAEPKHVLESALGIRGRIEIQDLSLGVEPGDKFVFTTDGVHGLMRLREVYRLACAYDDPGEFLAALDQSIRERRAKDNYSAVAVFAKA